MIYDLHWDPELYKTYASLPAPARRESAAALIDAQSDPLSATLPYGHDDGVIRLLETGSTLCPHRAPHLPYEDEGGAGPDHLHRMTRRGPALCQPGFIP